jgi:glycosyltransferase involved in cell wall biosynthesis
MGTERMTYLVANYNNGRYFRGLLASLEAQTDPNWRCLICDDASTDDSMIWISTLLDACPVKDRFRVFQNERNQGYTGTLKRLLANAETDIVALLDADDALMPEATEAVLSAYRQDARIAFVHSRHADMDASLQDIQGVQGERVPEGSTSLQQGFICHLWSFRRCLYHRTSGWDETMLYCEDRDLMYKLEEISRPVFIDRVLYKRRVLPTSQSHDPVKRKIGKINHIRARKNALRRRQISGMRFYRTVISYWLNEYPHPLMGLLYPLKWLLSKIESWKQPSPAP